MGKSRDTLTVYVAGSYGGMSPSERGMVYVAALTKAFEPSHPPRGGGAVGNDIKNSKAVVTLARQAILGKLLDRQCYGELHTARS